MDNIERSTFERGRYVGYGSGTTWIIRRVNRKTWRAQTLFSPYGACEAATLREISAKIRLFAWIDA